MGKDQEDMEGVAMVVEIKVAMVMEIEVGNRVGNSNRTGTQIL